MEAIYGTASALRFAKPYAEESPRLSRYRTDIDGLRAIAVLPVVLFHIGYSIFSGGFVGVDVFFVISGYLITASLLGDIKADKYSLAAFYERRIRRIIPALFAMLSISGVAAYILLLPENLMEFGKSLTSTVLFSSNIFFWRASGDYFGVQSEFRPLLHTWSLSVEEQFYILFPVMLAIAVKSLRAGALPIIVLLMAAMSLALSIYAGQNATVANFYMLPTRAWELLVGSALALGVVPKPQSRLQAETEAGCGLLLILASIFLYTSAMPFPGLTAIPPVLGAALILHAGETHVPSTMSRILSNTSLRFVGLISYSLYLWHWPIIVFSRYYWIELTPMIMAAILIASIGMATLSWRFIEAPFRGKNAWLDRPQLFRITAGIIGLGALLGITIGQNGLPERVPADIRRIAEKSTHQGPNRDCGGIYRQRRTIDNLCLLGQKGPAPEILLVGDSHAEAIAASVFEAAGASNQAGYQITDTGYRPLLGLLKAGEKEKYEYLNKMVTDFLDGNTDISKIIISLYWKQAIYIDGYVDRSGRPVPSKNAVEMGLRTLISRYPDREFLIVMSPPDSITFGGNAAARARWFGHVYRPIVGRADFDRLRERYQPIADKLAQLPNVTILDVSNKFCDVHVCYGTVDGQPAYSDDNHLSYRASKIIRGDIVDFIG